MFYDCSGPCCTCACDGFCIAGPDEDNYALASKNELINRLESRMPSPEVKMAILEALERGYGVDYICSRDMRDRAKVQLQEMKDHIERKDGHTTWHLNKSDIKWIDVAIAKLGNRAKWEHTNDDVFMGGYRCSNCKREAGTNRHGVGYTWLLTPYCPNCGAEMEIEDDTREKD